MTYDAKSEKREILPIFFAVDDKYAPYLAVAIRSLAEHISPEYDYKIYVLIDSLSDLHRQRLSRMADIKSNLSIEFVNVAKQLDALKSMLLLRDYYTRATYYRFFIPELFPQYDRGVYLDCDIILQTDVAKLCRTDLGDNIVAAAPEEVMAKFRCFGRYVEVLLGMPYETYFSAGVMIMDLAQMRRLRIADRFVELLNYKKFPVTQDQDYLNVLCYGKVLLLPSTWNVTAFGDVSETGNENLIHFKINWKPWHYSGITFENYFWDYASRTEYLADLKDTLANFSKADREEDARQFDSLVKLALDEVASVKGTDYIPPKGLFS